MDTFRWRAFAVSDCRVFLVFADVTRERPLVLRDAARGFFFGYRLGLDFATLAMPLTALTGWPPACSGLSRDRAYYSPHDRANRTSYAANCSASYRAGSLL
jgi:hypothetical protein